MNSSALITAAATALMIIFGVVGDGPSTYRYAVFFLAPILWGVYLLRNRLHIHPASFALLAGALLLHDLGAFGAYRRYFYGLEFDTYVHFFFGFAGGLVVTRALRFSLELRAWQRWLATVLVIMGIGALHELMEYGTTLVLGPEKGMLKVHDPDRFDTQKDLGNNLLGTLTALAVYAAAVRLQAGAALREQPGSISGSERTPATR